VTLSEKWASLAVVLALVNARETSRTLSAEVLLVAVFVYDELPETVGGPRRPEMLEVEREYRQPITLGDRHHRCVAVAEAEISKRPINLDGAPQKRRRQIDHHMLAVGQGIQKQAGSVSADPGAQQLIDLDDHRLGNEQIPSKLGQQSCRKRMGFVPAVRSSDQRPRVGDDPQRASTSSFRYLSAARPRSSGPSPAAT
jgi:hypothetical protein